MTPLATTQLIFDAFLKGDVPTLLDQLADDIEWEYGGHSVDVPWYVSRRGKQAVVGFFEALAEVTWHRFEIKDYLLGERVVAALIDSDYAVTRNGRRIVYEDAILLFRYDEQGKVARFAHRVDLHQAWLAWHA